VVIRFAFFNAYHHRIAYFLHNGGFEYAALAVWKQRAANATTIPTFRRSVMEFLRNFFRIVYNRLGPTGRFSINETLGLFFPGS
jgi:hypothetical protein